LTDVFKWLCFFFKAKFPMVNDLWVFKFKKTDIPCDSSWILSDFTRMVEVINNLNRSRSEIDKASPLLLQTFEFSTLYTKIDLVDLKARMRVLINKVFNQMLKFHRFKFLLVQKTTLNFRFLWLKNKAEINLFENLHSFRFNLLAGFLIKQFISFFLVRMFIDNALVSPWVQIVRSIWLISISSLMSLLKSMSHVMLCFIVCPWFIGLRMIFLFLIFQILRTSCTLTNTLLVAAYTQKPLVS